MVLFTNKVNVFKKVSVHGYKLVIGLLFIQILFHFLYLIYYLLIVIF